MSEEKVVGEGVGKMIVLVLVMLTDTVKEH